ncbi:hypothetical protein, partial [Idiomarina xiamenensis]
QINGIKTAIGRVVASAVVGGTLSKITGSKFANGAMTAAFAAVLRADWGGDNRTRSPNGEPITAEEKEKFEPEFAKMKKGTANAGSFKTSEAAAEWLHDNVHNKLSVDVEVGAYIYGSDDAGFTIGELSTSYMRNTVDMNMVGSAHSSWHSHGTNSFYWRPSAGLSNDTGWDVKSGLTYGYTSTSWNGGTLWQFNSGGFKGDHTWGNTCKYLTNLSGGAGC